MSIPPNVKLIPDDIETAISSTSSSSTTTTTTNAAAADAPLTMAASLVLTHLPKDASKALEKAGSFKAGKSTFNVFFA